MFLTIYFLTSHVSYIRTYIQIFSRILRSFHLPVGRKEFQATSSKDCFEPTKAAQLIVGMMVRLDLFIFNLKLIYAPTVYTLNLESVV